MFILRDYQQQVINETRQHMANGTKRILLQCPTGSGKTAMATHMIKTASERGNVCWFNVHRRELIKQSMAAFTNNGLNAGITSAKFPAAPSRPIQINSIPSLTRRHDKLATPQVVVWDEAHHIAANSWSNIFNAYPDAYHLLLTATPQRLDGRGLGDYADVIVNGPQTSWLIENGFLSPYRAFAPNQISMANIPSSMGDFNKKAAAELLDKPTIVGSAIEEYKKICPGSRALMFCVTVEASKKAVKQFNDAGISAMHVDGDTPVHERDNAIKMFELGLVKVLSNVGLFSEGVNLPVVECLIMLRPTQSLGMFLQMCGRVLRIADGKFTAYIIDHVGNFARHGMPCDERTWTLKGREKRPSKVGEAPVKICTVCFAAQHVGNGICKYCGNKFKITEREIREKEGELVELEKSKAKVKAKNERGAARSLEDLIALGNARGYKNPEKWASHVFNGRKN